MRNKYALVVTSSTTYFLGLNTLLNGLDYYGHDKDIDVYVIYGRDMLPYLDFAKDKFSFPLYYVPIRGWGDMESRVVIRGNPEVPYGEFDENANACWAKYNFLINAIDANYEAVCLIDADCMLLTNIHSYFGEAITSGNIICPSQHRTRIEVFDGCQSYEVLHKAVPGHCLENYPVFYDPKKHHDINEYIWEHRDKTSPNDPDLFNEGAVLLKKHKQITYLDNETWLSNFPHQLRNYRQDVDGKLAIFNFEDNRINIWHSRWWRRDANQSILNYAMNNEDSLTNATNNVKLGEDAIVLFNSHKVTFKDVYNLGYKQEVGGWEAYV